MLFTPGPGLSNCFQADFLFPIFSVTFYLDKSKCKKMDVRGLNKNPRQLMFEFREEEVGLEGV